jgi:hypothetical protein
VRSISVDDFSVERSDDANWVYRSGWMPIPSHFVTPSFGAALITDLRRGLKTTSSSGDAGVEIALLDAGLFMDKKATDDIAFVGIAMAFRERQYQCRAVLNIKLRGASERVVFEAEETRNRGFADLDADDARKMIESCKAKLLKDIHAHIAKRVSS